MIKTGLRSPMTFLPAGDAPAPADNADVPKPLPAVSGFARYCLTVHRAAARTSAIANILVYHLINHAEMLGLKTESLTDKNFIDRMDTPTRNEWAQLGAMLEPLAGVTQAEPWADRLAALHGLNADERALLRAVIDIGVQPEIHMLAMALVNGAGLSCGRLLDLLCGLPPGTTLDLLRAVGSGPELSIARHEPRLGRGALPPRSTLADSGLLIYHIDINTAVPRPHPVLAEAIRLGIDPQHAPAMLIGVPPRTPTVRPDMPLVETAMALHDFPLIEAGDWAEAVTNGTAPANIAIGGVPGCRRREAAAQVAATLGLPLRELAQPLPTDDRDMMLQLYRLQGRGQDEVCLLRSGADAMLASLSMNESIDLFDNAMPAIWLIDRPSALPEHVTRMFDAIITLPETGSMEFRSWRLEDGETAYIDDVSVDSFNAIEAPFDEARGKADWAPRAPAIAPPGSPPAGPQQGLPDGAMAARFGQRLEILKTAGRPRPPVPEIVPAIYDTALVNADQDLIDLAARLCRPKAPKRFSLLLWGMAGTGKSAYLRWLAGQMGLPVKHKRCSDLVDRWVGATEQNIATAFAEARQEGSFLIFDEADSLLADRRDSRNSWEVGQVNEMLTQMEAHPLPFACTTNLVDRLDQASMRRFLLKVRFDPLTEAQVMIAWKLFFDRAPSIDIGRLGPLTPADFDLVKREAELLHDDPDDLILRDLLIRETGRREAVAPIGFGRRI